MDFNSMTVEEIIVYFCNKYDNGEIISLSELRRAAKACDVIDHHSDKGSPMKGATMLETLYSLGIIPSRSRPRVSNDNPYAESLFKTLKYVPNYQPEGFATLTEARLWVKHFVDWYNNEHRHSGINYVTPSERHERKDIEILEKRKEVYEKAREVHPERWSRDTKNWDYNNTEWLNPSQKTEEIKETKVS